MAHDFASRQRQKKQPDVKESRTRGAVPKPADTEENSSPVGDFWARLPPWGWLVAGCVIGMVFAQLLPSGSDPVAVAEVEEINAQAATAVVVEEAEPGNQPRFDFYTLLPESEVIAPKIEAYQSTPRDAENLPRFMLQTGSFRHRSDAEQQQQRLNELGFDNVHVSSAESSNGTWYRVRVGPYQDRRLRARAQDDLASAGYEFMLLSLREDAPVEGPVASASEASEPAPETESSDPSPPLLETLSAEELAQLPRFMVQVGSFRRMDDAQSQKQRLQDLDFTQVSISEVQTAAGDTWQRVQIGPYQNPDQLAQTQEILKAAGMDFMLLRLREEQAAEERGSR